MAPKQLPETPPVTIPALAAALNELRDGLPDDIDVADLANWKDTATAIRVYAKALVAEASMIESLCAEVIPRESGATVESGGRTFKRTGSRDRKWKRDEIPDLIRLVLDAREVIIPPGPKSNPMKPVDVLGKSYVPGDVVDLSPADRLRYVFAFGDPRVGALTACGLDPDDWRTEGEWTNRDVVEIGTDDDE